MRVLGGTSRDWLTRVRVGKGGAGAVMGHQLEGRGLLVAISRRSLGGGRRMERSSAAWCVVRRRVACDRYRCGDRCRHPEWYRRPAAHCRGMRGSLAP